MIAVLGATGRVGRHVAAALSGQPLPARALVRRPDAADVPLPTVAADLADAASVRAALEGATRLFLLTPHGPDQDLLEAVAVSAAADAGVQHVVKVSGGAASLGPSGTTATATAHWRSEQRIEQSGMGFTFLRPSFFQQNLLTAVASVVARTGLLVAPFGRSPIAMVDVRDVAASAVAALTDPDPLDQAWTLTGPRGVTFDDVAALIGVRYVPVPPRAAGRTLRRRGASAHEADHAVRMAAYFAAGCDGTPTGHVRQLTGRAPRPVSTLLAEHRGCFTSPLPPALARVLSRTTIQKA
ncbi:NAD(P)H azoreductase [Paraconexibacter sp. AEG42_29]|uniref:NAD(P)H azoreductase n=1 Tax=Paraconexibacter sp. AEG42_29 TaxID=2997339 RepID=A0AAU7AU66_9ACTN